MNADTALLRVLGVAVVGLLLSVVVEKRLVPTPKPHRPLSAWMLHCGLWLFTFGVLVLLMGRPICAMVATSAMLITLVLVNNAKYASMREPFLFHDYDYFIDTIRFPRLFLPFLGVKSFCLAAAFFILAIWGFFQEAPYARLAIKGLLGGVFITVVIAISLLALQKILHLHVTLEPNTDIQQLGLLASIWVYGARTRKLPVVKSPFVNLAPMTVAKKPHLIAIQSESFFDPRTICKGIKQEVLEHFDAICAESALHGNLTVPAWGANTVRTEFAFLSGITPGDVDAHQFHPYQTVARGWFPTTLPHYLKTQGYNTVCIHPHYGAFYQRDWVLPKLGFDMFLDIKSFPNAQRQGPYIADMEVAGQIEAVLKKAQEPTFIFAITMENHGPLHLEKVGPNDDERFYVTPPPVGCEELTIYLRHLAHANGMVGMLHDLLLRMDASASLCWYGDHVPIMPAAYATLQRTPARVPFFCWSNGSAVHSVKKISMSAHELAPAWLEHCAP